MRVSVALATFNGAPFIARQLETILAQTRPPDEIVITDDGSSDGTVDVLEALAARAPSPIRVHRNAERLGYGDNFLRAAGLCSGDILFFCDQDDVWGPEKIARMLACFDDPEVLLAWHNAAITDQDEVRLGALQDPRFETALVGHDPPHPWQHPHGFTQAFRRELMRFDDLRAGCRDHKTDAPLTHEQWYVFLARVLGRTAYVPEELTLYRQHGANVFGAGRRSGLFRRVRARLSPPADSAARIAAARMRAETLQQIAARSAGAQAARARCIAAHYAALAERWSRRELIGRGPIGQRLASMERALRDDYGRNDPWRFPGSWIALDLVRIVAG